MFPLFGVSVRVLSCLFHFSQAVLRKFRTLTKGSKPRKEQYMVLRVLLFAPFIELSFLSNWLQKMLARENPLPEMFRYMCHVWLPRYCDWHLWPNCPTIGIYTNCALEGYHGRVNSEMGAVHPKLEHFAESFFQIDMNILA